MFAVVFHFHVISLIRIISQKDYSPRLQIRTGWKAYCIEHDSVSLNAIRAKVRYLVGTR